jgi:hypothetical protein
LRTTRLSVLNMTFSLASAHALRVHSHEPRQDKNVT